MRSTDIKVAPDIWPAPTAIEEGLPPVPEFSEPLLPEAIRPWILDTSERMQAPPDFMAAGAIVAAGAVVGRARAVRPRRHDDWTEHPVLWGAIVARPGLMKSPALEASLAPIKMLAARAREQHRDALKEFEFESQVIEARKAEARKKLGKATREELERLRPELEAGIEPPPARRLIVNDATIEKLSVILKDNPRGVLLHRDELTGWIASMDREGHQEDRGFYLQSWSGRGSYVTDRIGRGTIDVPALCVSVLGGIQPGPLGVYLRSALHDGQAADGFLQRFQVMVYPDVTTWRNIDRAPDVPSRARAVAAYEYLDALPVESFEQVPTLGFDAAGQELFDCWLGELESRVRSGTEHPAFEAHLSKYKKLVPSLALVGHLIDRGEGAIGVESVSRALAWADYLEAHARRVYASVTQADDIAALTLLKKIKTGEIWKDNNAKPPLVARDIYRRCWSGLSTLEDVEGALTRLEMHGYLRRVEVPTAGRPRVEYLVHPEIRKGEASR